MRIADMMPIQHPKAVRIHVIIITTGSYPSLYSRSPPFPSECLEGLGAELFSQASRLLHELEPEEAEEALQGLLGRERCTALAGKLQELRLCEESLDGL